MKKSLPSIAWYILTRYLLSTKSQPFLASYKLTYHCNLRCQQCPFPAYAGPIPSYEQVCLTLDRLYERGDRVVVFEGGEPLLWRDGEHTFQDVARYARQRFFCTGVTTNGTLPLEADTDILWVSLDGFAETHNRLRGAGIFEQVIAGIRTSTHPKIYAHITANAVNYAEIPALVRYLSDLVKGITVQFYYPYGANDTLFLPWLARSNLLDDLIRLKKRGFPVMNSAASLRALKSNRWRCRTWLVDCANPDGSIQQGCYLEGRTTVDCTKCGFSPYSEISLAFGGNPEAILAGFKIFFGE